LPIPSIAVIAVWATSIIRTLVKNIFCGDRSKDHFWQLSGVGYHDEPFVECYTGLSAVAAATDSMRLSALVTCVHYRNPALLAKTVASLDSLSGGRAVLAIGAGWYEDEYDAAGLDFPPADERIRQTRDAIQLCETAWTEPSPVDYDGAYYDLDGLILEPKPDVPVMVGGGGEQLTLRLTAHLADAWNVPGSDPETYAHKLDVLRDHCDDLGTDYDAIEKTVTLQTCLRGTTGDAHGAYERLMTDTEAGPTPRDEFRGAVGTAAEVADLVETYRDLGVDTFQIQPVKNDRETVERFVDDVYPEFA
jgi:alkanesulfonate monooxygenase SsuD/methylene tetrahydromethanopterin reductase-like flavin-dependent oxidoreductase (luciferase family)